MAAGNHPDDALDIATLFENDDVFGEKTEPDTHINFGIDVRNSETVSRTIIDKLRTRQPLLVLYDQLKYQKENVASSSVFKLEFKPMLGCAANHEKLDQVFSDIVSKHRTGLVTEVLGALESVIKTQTDGISTMYGDECRSLKEAPRATVDQFVNTVRQEKSALEKRRLEANARLNTPLYAEQRRSNDLPGGYGDNAKRPRMTNPSNRGYQRRGRGAYTRH